MLYRDADILIFDEPTAVLTPQAIRELIKIMRRLIEEGKSIVLITHKLRKLKLQIDVQYLGVGNSLRQSMQQLPLKKRWPGLW